jgi:hypothetical protein
MSLKGRTLAFVGHSIRGTPTRFSLSSSIFRNKKTLYFLNMRVLLITCLAFAVVYGHDRQCFVPGQCIGELFGATTKEANVDNCLNRCHGTFGCNWFTYNKDTRYCGVYEGCNALDDILCPGCISGEVSCSALPCRLSGMCVGNFLHHSAAESLAECQVCN